MHDKEELLAWFRLRGFWEHTTDQCFCVLNQLDAHQLWVLSVHVGQYGLHMGSKGHAAAMKQMGYDRNDDL